MRRTTSALLVVTGLATLGVYAAPLVLGATTDHVATFDSHEVREAASRACTDLRVAVDAAPTTPATAPARAGSARRGAALVDALVRDLSALGAPALDADVPAQAWLDDWRTLAQALRDYADSGATTTFDGPLTADRPLVERMQDVGVEACEVVPLTALGLR